MKTKAFTFFILIFISTTLFAQDKILKQKKEDKQSENFEYLKPKNQFKDSLAGINSDKIDSLLMSINHPRINDGMPVVKPKGNFTMPIMVPDSTIDFKLKVKGYKPHSLMKKESKPHLK